MKTTTKKTRRSILTLLAVFLLSICTAMPALAAAPEYIGYDGPDPNRVLPNYEFDLYVLPKDRFDALFQRDDETAINNALESAVPESAVVYCMNRLKKEPTAITINTMYDYLNGSTLESLFWYNLLPVTTPDELEAITTSTGNKETNYTGLAYVAKKGYPNGRGSTLQGGLSDTEFRAVTQWAVYHYTESSSTIPREFSLEQQACATALTTVPAGYDPAPEWDQINVYKPVHLQTGADFDARQHLISFDNRGGAPVTPAYYPVPFIKTDDNDVPLAGATLRICTDQAGETLAQGKWNETDTDLVNMEWTSTTATTTVYLAEGDYYLAESRAPSGYTAFPGTVKFTVGNRGALSCDPTDLVFFNPAGALKIKNKATPTTPQPGDPNSNINGQPENPNSNSNSNAVDGGRTSANTSKTAGKTAPPTADSSALMLYAVMFVLSGTLIVVRKRFNNQQ